MSKYFEFVGWLRLPENYLRRRRPIAIFCTDFGLNRHKFGTAAASACSAGVQREATTCLAGLIVKWLSIFRVFDNEMNNQAVRCSFQCRFSKNRQQNEQWDRPGTSPARIRPRKLPSPPKRAAPTGTAPFMPNLSPCPFRD